MNIRKECNNFDNYFCKAKNKSVKKTTCTQKCYKYTTEEELPLHKEIVWLSRTDHIMGYISGIEFFKMKPFNGSVKITTTIPSFVDQKFKSINECKDWACSVVSIYIKRIANV